MKINLVNVAWLIIVTLFTINANAQITVDSNFPVELNVICDQLNEITPPIANSTCEGELNYSYKDMLLSGGCMGTIIRTWTIIDDCGNQISLEQYIRRSDETVPTLSDYPINISASKNDVPDVPEITATDNCTENIVVNFSEENNLDQNGSLISINRKWIAVDKCNNITQHIQVISILKDES